MKGEWYAHDEKRERRLRIEFGAILVTQIAALAAFVLL